MKSSLVRWGHSPRAPRGPHVVKEPGVEGAGGRTSGSPFMAHLSGGGGAAVTLRFGETEPVTRYLVTLVNDIARF